MFLIILAINAISCHYDSSVKENVHEFVINWLVLPWSAFSLPRRFRFSSREPYRFSTDLHHSYADHLRYQYQNHDPHSTQCEDDFEQQQDVFDDFLAGNLYNEIIDSYIRDYFTVDETTMSEESAAEKLVDDNSKVPSPVDTTSRSPYTSPVEEVVDGTLSVTSSPTTIPSSSPTSSPSTSPSSSSFPSLNPTTSLGDVRIPKYAYYARGERLTLGQVEALRGKGGALPFDDYGDIIKTSWCADSENHKDACNGSIVDCFIQGMEYCQKVGDSCFGVMVHPLGWTLNHKAFKICTSISMVPKSDWWTRLKIQQPVDTQYAAESDEWELITGLSDEECVNKLCCNDWQSPWHHLCYTGPHCSKDCSDCNGDPSICHNKQNAGWQRFVPKDKIDTSPPALSPSKSPTSSPSSPPTTRPSSSPSSPTTSPLLPPTSYPSGSPTSSPSTSPTWIPSLSPSTTPSIPTPPPSRFYNQDWPEWCVEDCESDIQLDGVDCPFGCMMSLWISFCMIVHIYRNCTRVDEEVVEAHLEEPSSPSPQEAQEVAQELETPKKIEEKQTDDWEVIQQRETSDQDGYVMVN